MEVVKRVKPPKGLARLLFRLPIKAYRLRMGWLFGGRLMLVTHTGRKTGKQRQAVIEIVGRQGASYLACSGFGTGAAWYRNVLATPEVTIQVGNRNRSATAEPLDEEAGADAMARYALQHPRAARRLCRSLMGFAVDGSEADYREVGRRLPFVRFTPRA